MRVEGSDEPRAEPVIFAGRDDASGGYGNA
jgi:hypothetical protein